MSNSRSRAGLVHDTSDVRSDTAPVKKAPNVYPCNVCGVDAVACYRPDMDIKGLCFCTEHQNEVQMVYMSIGSVPESVIKSLMAGWKFK